MPRPFRVRQKGENIAETFDSDPNAIDLRVTALEASVVVLDLAVADHASRIDVLEMSGSANVASQLAVLSASVADLNVRTSALETSVLAHHNTIQDLVASTAANASSIVVLTASTTAFEVATASNFAITNASVAANQSAINVVSASLASFELATASNFAITNASVVANQSNLNVLSASLASFELATASNFAITNASVAQNASVIDTNSSNITQLFASVAQEASRISVNEGDITTLFASVASNASSIIVLFASVANNASGIASNASSIIQLSASVAQEASRISVLEASVAQNSSVIGVHTGQISDLFVSTAANASQIVVNQAATTSNFAITNASVAANQSAINVVSASLASFELATASNFVITNASVAANASAIALLEASVFYGSVIDDLTNVDAPGPSTNNAWIRYNASSGNWADTSQVVGSGSLINCLDMQELPGGEPVLAVTDPTRSSKNLGVDTFSFTWTQAVINAAGGYMQVGVANASSQGFTCPIDATLIWATMQVGNNGANGKAVDLHVNGSILTGGSNIISISGSPTGLEASSRTDCDLDVSGGDNLSVFVEASTGNVTDGVVTLWFKTRF